MNQPIACLILALLFCIVDPTNSISATDGVWTGAAADDKWSSAENWNASIIPGIDGGDPSDTATFGIDDAKVNIDVPVSLGVITVTEKTDFEGDNVLSFSNDNSVLTLNGQNTDVIIDSVIDVLANKTLTVNLEGELTFPPKIESFTGKGRISGEGNLTIAGSANSNVFLITPSPLTGTVTINGGRFYSALSLASSSVIIEADANGLFSGSITGNLENSGVCAIVSLLFDQPDLEAPTTLTTSNFKQNANGGLIFYVNPTASSQLIVQNNATLDGAVLIAASAGIYPPGTTWQIMTSGARAGVFSSMATLAGPVSFGVEYDDTNGVILKVLGTSALVVTPTLITDLQGNSYAIGNYFFGDANFILSNSDLIAVSNSILALSSNDFNNNLIRLTPIASAGLPMSTFQSDLQMAVVLDRQYQKKIKRIRKNQKTQPYYNGHTTCYGVPRTGVFIEPIGIVYNQKIADGAIPIIGQVPFKSYTYGAGIGAELVFNENFIAEGGVGYTHSNLNWHQDFGNSRWSTIYWAPFVGWFNQQAFANIMVMGAVNFFQLERKIIFPAFERIAKSRFNSYDILWRTNAGVRLSLGKNYWIQPDFTFNYLIILTEKYTESGAGSISLNVDKNRTFVVQPSIRTRLIKEYYFKKYCLAPCLYLGWLSNVSNQGSTASRFTGAPNRIFFNIQGYNQTVNQLIVGAEILLQRYYQMEINASFEADLLDRLDVYIAKIKVEWFF